MAKEFIFEEYKLDNDLHVILHQDNSAPVVTIGVMYHVGAKDEDPTRTGFAHFFEHLLFEGTQHIGRGKWFDIVSSNGGHNNAFTTQDKTYYYENAVVKEEKNQRIDNAPYGKIMYRSAINPHLFKKHPYAGTVIGKIEHLDAATLEEFIAFKKKFYNPNNAVLVLAGDFDKTQAKQWIAQYFGTIPNTGEKIHRCKIEEAPITETIKATDYDPNIQIPLKLYAYRTPAMKDRDSFALAMLSYLLTDGKSARLYKKMIDEHQTALQVLAFSDAQEDYGTYIMGALPMDGVSLDTLGKEIDEEIEKLQTELISEREYEKLQNQIEAQFVSQHNNMEGIALSLADHYTFYNDTHFINKAIYQYRSIMREEIRDAARKYLDKNKRLELDYLPTN